jgi:hypothetical protein
LDVNFENHWIGRGGPINWSARSPDLTPLDFFVWGYLKHKVFQHKIDNLEHLMEIIIRECKNITPQQLKNSIKNFNKRVQLCIMEGGGLFEHLL